VTQQTFTAHTPGAVWADVTSHMGIVNVTVDRSLTHAEITVSTPDEDGLIADAVREAATSREYTFRGLNVFAVEVPQVNTAVTQVGGTTFTSSGVRVVQNAGIINTGAIVSNGDVWVGGRQVVHNGTVVAERGTVVGGASASGLITVDVRLPSDLSSLRLETTSADLQVRGDLQVLDVTTVSGDVEADRVHTVYGNTTSGDVEIEAVDARVDVTTVSGDVEIDAYSGGEFRVNSVSGDVTVTATKAAHGTLAITTISGDATTCGASHLPPRISTVSGRKRVR
jgi:putative adhesin